MKIKETLLQRQEIEERVSNLGQQLTKDYAGKKPVAIGILNGAFIFLADLVRAVELPVEVDFIRVASYGEATESSGSITLTKEPELDLTGKDILLVEDIVDSGATMAWLQEYFTSQHKPNSVKTCTLIDKSERRAVDIQIDYVGFQIEKGFLVGYGLDCAQTYRNLPQICSMEEAN
ncbi:MAG: hypoxanthine phosphoribosyltransferase [Candidatus Electrothrix sp.]